MSDGDEEPLDNISLDLSNSQVWFCFICYRYIYTAVEWLKIHNYGIFIQIPNVGPIWIRLQYSVADPINF